MLSVVARHVGATRALAGIPAATAVQRALRLRTTTATTRSSARRKHSSDDKGTSKTGSSSRDQNKKQKSRRLLPARTTLSVLVPLIPIAIVLWELAGLEIAWVSGRSMAPYLNDQYGRSHLQKDRVLVRRVGADTPLERGMVVLFRSLVNPSYISVKRIIGLPGDRVSPRPGPATPASPASSSKDKPTPTIVPWNHLWIEGEADDSRLSVDSNAYGPISRNLVSGRVVAVLSWSGVRALRWQDWEDQDHGQGRADRGDDEGEERSGWRQRRRVEKGAVAVREPVTF